MKIKTYKPKTALKIITTFLVLTPLMATNIFTNGFMLLTERENSIPEESSIFFFHPYIISQGSSNIWLYGRDKTNYYYFTGDRTTRYIYTSSSDICPHFSDVDFRTWCNPHTTAKKTLTNK